MKPIISVDNLGKCYRISHKAADAPTNFREVLAGLPQKLFKGGTRTKPEEFWALDGVSFNIMPGERVGIIGRNGAGKSTLLKLLSRITEPTRGKITMRGRSASLLEVGTGFHSELTGRENIFLNGAILGMSQAEVSKKFDEIVDFAGVENFLDTPVKRYSSGMFVRLGFAVAAHLEPEILIVDEVLAVGDMEFQKKCLNKMESVSKENGRTVLFVSHNLQLVRALCHSGVLLENGLLDFYGDVEQAIAKYKVRSELLKHAEIDFGAYGDEHVKLVDCSLVDENYCKIENIYTSSRVGIKFSYEVLDIEYKPDLSVHVTTDENESVFLSVCNAECYLPGKYTWIAWIPENLLNNKIYMYYVGIFSAVPITQHVLYSSSFSVEEDYNSKTRKNINYNGPFLGVVRPILKYEKIS